MYKAFDKFVLRTPVLSIGEIGPIYSCPDSFLDDPLVLEALILASPDFFEIIQKYRRHELNNKDVPNAIITLILYLSRMSCRCTPFGLFAKCSVGTFGNQDSLVVDSKFERHTRPDHILINRLISTLLKKDDVAQRNIKYYPNTSLYRIGRNFRLIEVEDTNKRNYNLAEIGYSAMLLKVLNTSSNGSTLTEIVDMMTAKGYDLNESCAYVSELIESQVLVNGIDNLITGTDAMSSIKQMLEESVTDHSHIRSFIHDIDLLDNNPPDHKEVYDRMCASLNDSGIDIEMRSLLQVDCIGCSDKLSLNRSIANDVEKCIKFLSYIAPAYVNPTMTSFKSAFKERYGDRRIPLCEALDPHLGIGYPDKRYFKAPSIILEGLMLPQEDNNTSHKESTLDRILLRKLEEMYRVGEDEIILSDEDIIGTERNPYPDTIFALTEMSKKNAQHYIRIKAVAGNSAANLLSRFAVEDHRINDFIYEIVDKEKSFYKDAILAEIVHADSLRMSNVLFRPNMRDYEIVYLANSTIDEERKIHVSELELSIRDGHFFLYSTKLGKQIIPYLTCAIDYSTSSLPIYRFLCDLQFDKHGNAMPFHWGYLNGKLNFYPRVSYENCVLSLAKWRIDVKDLISIKSLYRHDDRRFLNEINLWRSERNIPLRVQYIDGDHAFLVDFTAIRSIDVLIRLVKNKQNTFLHEYFFDNDDFMIRDENSNAYTNEFIFCFFKEKN